MRVAVLVKQVPVVEEMELAPDGRLKRDGVELEMNAYCRRAVSKGVELARKSSGTCVVFTLGPAAAEDTLREALAWGADEGVHVTDAAFAGSDTLATAAALAAALRREGPFDLVLVGRNSIDADTGQVGPEVAELLDLPFAAGVKELALSDGVVEARCELDDGWRLVRVALPAVLSTAERLTEPCKVAPDGRAAVDAARIRRVPAADLGPGPWGAAGSPTVVGEVRSLEVARRGVVLSGDAASQVGQALGLLREWGALDAGHHRHDPDGAEPDGSAEPDVDAVGPRRARRRQPRCADRGRGRRARPPAPGARAAGRSRPRRRRAVGHGGGRRSRPGGAGGPGLVGRGPRRVLRGHGRRGGRGPGAGRVVRRIAAVGRVGSGHVVGTRGGGAGRGAPRGRAHR